jgi:hypothetical protein
MNTQLARSALWYARHGWHVFPLRPHTKEPFAGIGAYNATTDTDQIMDWWTHWPQANVGMHCGGSGLLAIDLDTYKDSFGGDGFLSATDQETVTSLTGSGGTHLIYAMPANRKFTNATGNLPDGIDVRGQGGYIVLPPSIHPNGNKYQWEGGYGPHEIAPLPLPAGLLCILENAKAAQRVAGPPDRRAVATACVLVESIIESLDLDTIGPTEYDGSGRKWIMKTCPFNPEDNPHDRDRAAYIIIARDGHISAGCQHARCRERLKSEKRGGWKFLVQQAATIYG